MKRLLSFVLFSIVALTGCSAGRDEKSAGQIFTMVEENRDFFLSCAEEMASLGEDRIYVALEAEKEGEEEGETTRLVSYLKESGERKKIENETLRKALADFGFRLIFFQTASDGRQCIIFSFSKENETGKTQNGFYYSFDALPCAWWGRKGELIRRKNNYLQLQSDGSAGYLTSPITDNFYYFEKYGDLVA